MKIKHVFDLIFSDDNLYEAIQDASKGRRYNKDVLRVQHDIWNVIEQIQQDVRSGKYTIDKYYIFYVYEPKKRMIMSITFYHRIVQWAIYRVINPPVGKRIYQRYLRLYSRKRFACCHAKTAILDKIRRT